jgi:ATP-binding cassette subfamily B (MDR/TAP) protein 1
MSLSNPQEISNNEDDMKENSSKNFLRSCFHTPFFIKLLKLNSPEKFYLIAGSVCALLYGCVEPAVGLVYSMIYGLLANPNLELQSFRTRYLSLSIFGIYVLAGIVQFISTVTFAKAGEELTLRMRLFTFEAMLRREISWFDDEKNSVGSLVTRLSNDTAALKVNSIYSVVFFISNYLSLSRI